MTNINPTCLYCKEPIQINKEKNKKAGVIDNTYEHLDGYYSCSKNNCLTFATLATTFEDGSEAAIYDDFGDIE